MTWLEMGAQGLAARVAWNMGSSPAVGVGPVARWEEQLGPARALPGSRVLLPHIPHLDNRNASLHLKVFILRIK